MIILNIHLKDVKIIWSEIGLYLKTNPPLPYKAQRIPFDTKIIMKDNEATIYISEDDYKKCNLDFFKNLYEDILMH